MINTCKRYIKRVLAVILLIIRSITGIVVLPWVFFNPGFVWREWLDRWFIYTPKGMREFVRWLKDIS